MFYWEYPHFLIGNTPTQSGAPIFQPANLWVGVLHVTCWRLEFRGSTRPEICWCLILKAKRTKAIDFFWAICASFKDGTYHEINIYNYIYNYIYMLAPPKKKPTFCLNTCIGKSRCRFADIAGKDSRCTNWMWYKSGIKSWLKIKKRMFEKK